MPPVPNRSARARRLVRSGHNGRTGLPGALGAARRRFHRRWHCKPLSVQLPAARQTAGECDLSLCRPGSVITVIASAVALWRDQTVTLKAWPGQHVGRGSRNRRAGKAGGHPEIGKALAFLNSDHLPQTGNRVFRAGLAGLTDDAVAINIRARHQKVVARTDFIEPARLLSIPGFKAETVAAIGGLHSNLGLGPIETVIIRRGIHQQDEVGAGVAGLFVAYELGYNRDPNGTAWNVRIVNNYEITAVCLIRLDRSFVQVDVKEILSAGTRPGKTDFYPGQFILENHL